MARLYTWHIEYRNDDNTEYGTVDVIAPSFDEAIKKIIERRASKGLDKHE